MRERRGDLLAEPSAKVMILFPGSTYIKVFCSCELLMEELLRVNGYYIKMLSFRVVNFFFSYKKALIVRKSTVRLRFARKSF